MVISEAWIFPITFTCAFIGVLIVFLWVRHGNAGPDGARLQEMTCTVCHKQLYFESHHLEPLSPPETVLAVRAHPRLVGKKLAEYVCPYCEAAHCFVSEARFFEWIGVNLYEPRQKTANCLECGKPLRRPSWPQGAYGGHPKQALVIEHDHGLRCPHCNAMCCYACCENNTRERVADENLTCPRCFRAPMTQFFH